MRRARLVLRRAQTLQPTVSVATIGHDVCSSLSTMPYKYSTHMRERTNYSAPYDKRAASYLSSFLTVCVFLGPAGELFLILSTDTTRRAYAQPASSILPLPCTPVITHFFPRPADPSDNEARWPVVRTAVVSIPGLRKKAVRSIG